MTSPLGEHNFGTHYLMTGYKPTPVLEYPTFGAVAAHVRAQSQVLPPNIAVPSFAVGGSKITGSGCLPWQVAAKQRAQVQSPCPVASKQKKAAAN